MGTRIVVKCRSQQIPGDSKLRLETMANLVCQHVWQRDFDDTQDRIRSSGQYDCEGVRCFFLVDNGPPESLDISMSMYKWDGVCL